MKINRIYVSITLSCLALAVVLAIQVWWILRIAETKKSLFNETARLVISQTAATVNADAAAYITQKGVSDELRKHVDSLFTNYMKAYDLEVDYYFDLKPLSYTATLQEPIMNGMYNLQPNVYVACLNVKKDAPGPINSGTPVELRLVFSDPDQFVVQEMGMPFLASLLLVGLVMFVTWRNTMSLIREKEISERTTEFVNNMTHEFKTPLTNIRLATRMMTKEEEIREPWRVKYYADLIGEENDKLSSQVEMILSVAAMEESGMPLNKRDMDIEDVIKKAVESMKLPLEARRGLISLRFNASHTLVKGDAQLLSGVFRGLIDNAIKYSNGSPQIIIATTQEPDGLTITVTDKGIGVPEAYREKIFEKFVRVPTGDVHDVKGFGLGLAWIRKVLEAHGASIRAEEGLDGGTSFVIRWTTTTEN